MIGRLLFLLALCLPLWGQAQHPRMMYGDTSRVGVPYSKDPHVVNFKGRYLMYHSIPPKKGDEASGWNIGIAESKDLVNWTKAGEITPAPGADYEKKGLCAPGALVKDGQVHLFYQTYGNGKNDAICHAVSDDGVHFKRNPTNPIFHPSGDWTCGRAIDAEVCEFKGRYFLYFATRDKDYDIQMQGVAVHGDLRVILLRQTTRLIERRFPVRVVQRRAHHALAARGVKEIMIGIVKANVHPGPGAEENQIAGT